MGAGSSTDMGIIFVLISTQVKTTAKNPSPLAHISHKIFLKYITSIQNHLPAPLPPKSDMKNVGDLNSGIILISILVAHHHASLLLRKSAIRKATCSKRMFSKHKCSFCKYLDKRRRQDSKVGNV